MLVCAEHLPSTPAHVCVPVYSPVVFAWMFAFWFCAMPGTLKTSALS